MNIAVFDGNISPEKFGRVEVTQEVGSIEGLDQTHHLFVNPDMEPTTVEEDGIIHRNLGGHGTHLGDLLGYYFYGLNKYLRKNDVDVVYNLNLRGSFFVAMACKLAGVPVIQRVGNDMRTVEENRGPIKSFLYNVLWRSGLKAADDVHANSGYMKEVAIEYGASPGKVHRIYPNIETPPDTDLDPGFGEDGYVVTFIGRVTERKGVHILVEALPEIKEELPETTLYIVGSDPFEEDKSSYRKELDRLIEEKGLGDSVVFTGWVDYEDISAYYRGSDLVVAPSVHEGVNKVALESMLCGTPVIGSDIPTHRELIGTERGRVVERSGEAFAEAVVELLRDEDERRRLGRNAEEFANRIIRESRPEWQALFDKYRDDA